MLRLAAVALLTIGLALPACAQRGGFHGGGGGFHVQAGPAFRGGSHGFSSFRPNGSAHGFSSFRPDGLVRAPRYARPYGYVRPFSNRYRAPYNSFRNRQGYHAYRRRPDYWRGRRDRFRNRVYSYSGFAPPLYYYSVPDWIGLGPIGCDPDDNVYYYDGYDDFDCGGMQPDDQDQNQDQNQPQVYDGDNGNGYEPEPPYGNGSEPPPPPPDQPEYEPPAYHQPAPSQMPPNDVAANRTTTIIFNNGHAPEKIHDYALTMTTLYILGQNQQEIPLSEINLAATEQTNRSAGIEFRVPQYQITQ